MESTNSKQTLNKKAYDKKYRQQNMKAISFRLHKVNDADLIEIYEKIPDKMEWFRKALRTVK